MLYLQQQFHPLNGSHRCFGDSGSYTTCQEILGECHWVRKTRHIVSCGLVCDKRVNRRKRKSNSYVSDARRTTSERGRVLLVERTSAKNSCAGHVQTSAQVQSSGTAAPWDPDTSCTSNAYSVPEFVTFLHVSCNTMPSCLFSRSPRVYRLDKMRSRLTRSKLDVYPRA